MANLSIPERYQVGVSKMRSLSLETVRALRKALDNVFYKDQEPKPTDTATSALEAVLPPGTPKEEYRAVAEALVSMYLLKSSDDIELDEFTSHIANALEAVPNPELRLAPAERESFREKLAILLGAEMFEMISKIDSLRTDSENIFCHARILTDLRPVFGKDVERGPTSMLVTHTMKIAYHLSGRRGDHDFYVSLDADDLSELKALIARAEAKARTLRAAVDGRITLFGVSD